MQQFSGLTLRETEKRMAMKRDCDTRALQRTPTPRLVQV
jgi:hypothetical protein